jgi:hypothetical protein
MTIDEAAADASIRHIAVAVALTGLPSFRLSPGQVLTAASRNLALTFAAGEDGVQLSTDNRVEGLDLGTDDNRRVLYNDTGVERLGGLVLRGLRVVPRRDQWPHHCSRTCICTVMGIPTAIRCDGKSLNSRPRGSPRAAKPCWERVWAMRNNCVPGRGRVELRSAGMPLSWQR